MKFIIRAIITLFLLGIIIWILGGVHKVKEIISGMKPEYIPAVLLFHTIDRVLMTYKWLRLLRCKKINIPFLQAIRIYCASMIWGVFMPTTVASDAIRIYAISKKGHDTKEITVSVIIERMAGFISVLVLGIIGFIIISKYVELNSQFKYALWFGCLFLFMGIIFFILSFNQSFFEFLHHKLFRRFKDARVFKQFKQFHFSYKAYRNEKKEIIFFFILTFFEQFFPIITAWLVAKSLNIEIGLVFITGVLPLALLISRLPVSINGIGVFEGSFIFLMSIAGVPPVQSVAISFSARILEMIAWLPWWIVEVISKEKIKPPEVVCIKSN